MRTALLGCLVALALAAAGAAAQTVADSHVPTADGVRIFVREIRPAGPAVGEPVILIHGARAPGLASFDLPVARGSLARDLAERSHRVVFVMDARGYGASDRPPGMEKPAQGQPSVARSYEVVRDIGAVVAFARERTSAGRVSLFGWATGGLWAGAYAALHPERIGHLVTLNALYGANVPHPRFGAGSPLSDPKNPERFNPDIGAWTANEAASLRAVWERSIPTADKDLWRDPAIADALTRAVADSDPGYGRAHPGQFRAPSGALEDSFYQACGRRLYDASSITARVLLIRSGHDFWSRPEDLAAFLHDAAHAAAARALMLPDATHFAHLDRDERGRSELLAAVVRFLDE
ncbi:alpha/beta hydrolase [Massilia endophytica]|uniref:alpha/beta hydrolase n=1 Tax=Massilia endophytica TaxID=2899220 RepID=UPI001E388F3E|nr:alpha/beta fold hydrolase [Massilia endophytica]UGQ44575.1 alpha/beta fold hydrolase [Massilia endophytica]